MPKKVKAADLSYDERRQLLSRALPSSTNQAGAGNPHLSCYIEDVYDGSLTYRCYDYSSSNGERKLFRCSYSIGADLAVTLGEAEEVIARTVYEPVAAMSVAFSIDEATAGEEDGFILRPGKLFEAGDYPDKNFSMSEDEMDAAVAAFDSPAPMNIEHKPSPLDGHLGEIRKVWRKGKDLMALFAVPQWLDAKTHGQGVPLKVSAEFNLATKAVKAAAWTINPRVTDAALLAAFSASQTGSETLSAHSSAVTDTAATINPSGKEKKPLKSIKEVLSGLAAHFTQAAKDIDEAAGTETVAAAAAPVAPAATAQFAGSPEFVEMQKQIAKLTDDRIKAEAEAFAAAEIRAGRAVPSEKPGLIALFSQAASDDAAKATTITFAVGTETKTGSRVDALKALYASRPANGLTTEMVADAVAEGAEVLFSDAAGAAKRKAAQETSDGLNPTKIYQRRQTAIKEA